VHCDWKSARELAGLSQFATARKAGISRMRLSQAECGEIELQAKEQAALRRVLCLALEQRAIALRNTLSAVGAGEAPNKVATA
jgi:transcriptional regulator with XRE-family HTH domain